MPIQEGPDTHNEKAVKTKWPVVEGITGGTNKQVGKRYLHAERKTFLRARKMKGIW